MKFIDIRIQCLEDIKVTSALNQINTSESLSYIAGSSIRGAFINNYIKLFNIENINDNDEGKRWFFNNGLEFTNGYIEYAGDRTYPLPQGLYSDTISIENYHNKEIITVKNQLVNKISDIDKKFQPSEFIYIVDDNKAFGIAVNKLFNLHIRKGEDRKMFRYEAIEKGQVFKSIIQTSLMDNEIEKVVKVLEEGDFYIGGSKGSGYGKVKITVEGVLDHNPEVIKAYDEIENELIVFITSDGIFIDDEGNNISHIEPKWLQENLGIENVELVSASTEEILVGGYNKKWEARIPQYSAVKKGSLLKYRFEGKVKKDTLVQVQDKAYGLRTEEGFGRFIILPSFEINKMQIENKDSIRERKIKIKYTDEEREQLQFIVNSLARKKIEQKMKEIIVSNYETKGKVNKNQIGKIVQLFSLCQNKSMKEGLDFINDYIRHLEKNKNSKDGILRDRINQEALNQLQDLQIGNQSAINFIKREVEKFSLESFIAKYSINTIKIDNIRPSFDLEEVYVYKMIELENTFRYILRSR